jgi:hypothetical protein
MDLVMVSIACRSFSNYKLKHKTFYIVFSCKILFGLNAGHHEKDIIAI